MPGRQAVGRGVMQGRLGFKPLAATFVVEMVVRVSVGVTLVALGFGVIGATIGLTVSFLAVWIHVRLLERSKGGAPLDAQSVRSIITYASPVGVLLLGQIVINNGDVVSGVVVNLNGDSVTLNTDLSDPNQRTNVDRKEVKTMEVSKVSPMPPMLLNMLTKDEVLDLVAYVLSGGDAENAMFKK